MPGFRHESAESLGLPALPSTDGLTKEDFNALIPAFDSRIDFMFEILKSFSPEPQPGITVRLSSS